MLPVAEDVDAGEFKEKLGDVACVADFESSAEFAKKLGIEGAFVDALAPSCSNTGWVGADATTDCAGLFGTSAICGTAASIGVDGAGAETAMLLAPTVTGGLRAPVGCEKPLGRGSGPSILSF